MGRHSQTEERPCHPFSASSPGTSPDRPSSAAEHSLWRAQGAGQCGRCCSQRSTGHTFTHPFLSHASLAPFDKCLLQEAELVLLHLQVFLNLPCRFPHLISHSLSELFSAYIKTSSTLELCAEGDWKLPASRAICYSTVRMHSLAHRLVQGGC